VPPTTTNPAGQPGDAGAAEQHGGWLGNGLVLFGNKEKLIAEKGGSLKKYRVVSKIQQDVKAVGVPAGLTL